MTALVVLMAIPRLIKRFAKIEADKDARLIHAVITELSQSKIR